MKSGGLIYSVEGKRGREFGFSCYDFTTTRPCYDFFFFITFFSELLSYLVS